MLVGMSTHINASPAVLQLAPLDRQPPARLETLTLALG
jgi:hypothetical protein